MEFSLKHRKIVGIGTVRACGPKVQGGEVFGGSEDEQYMPTKNPGNVAVDDWDLGSS